MEVLSLLLVLIAMDMKSIAFVGVMVCSPIQVVLCLRGMSASGFQVKIKSRKPPVRSKQLQSTQFCRE
jgi:hypothetical protein